MRQSLLQELCMQDHIVLRVEAVDSAALLCCVAQLLIVGVALSLLIRYCGNVNAPRTQSLHKITIHSVFIQIKTHLHARPSWRICPHSFSALTYSSCSSVTSF